MSTCLLPETLQALVTLGGIQEAPADDVNILDPHAVAREFLLVPATVVPAPEHRVVCVKLLWKVETIRDKISTRMQKCTGRKQ